MNDSNYTKSEKTIVTKVCITCLKELPIEEFGKRRYRSNKPDAHWIYSRYGECLNCTSYRKALWRAKNPNYMKEWYNKQKQATKCKNRMNRNEIHYGIVEFYNTGRNYGFITEKGSTKEYFVCMTSLIDHIKAGSEVCFCLKDDPKGTMAVEVRLINNEALKIRNNGTSNNRSE